MSTPRLTVNNLSFHIDNTPVAFNAICLSFESKKYGVVGDNGVGKTTFLKLLCGQLQPDIGSIHYNGTLFYLPQSHNDIADDASISDALGVSAILSSMHRIQSGNCVTDDFDVLDNRWDIESRIENALEHFNIDSIDINSQFASFSGGQKTKLLLAKTLIFDSDFIVMDEPTNNLDKESRDILYQFIESTKKRFMIVSHDRTLFNRMDCMLEITSKEFHLYGGNYDFYQAQKTLELNALENAHSHAKHELEKQRTHAQMNREKAERRQSTGKNLRKSGSQAKILLDFQKSNAEKSLSTMQTKNARLLNDATSHLDSIKEKIEIKKLISASLDATNIPNGKTVLHIENLCFKYSAKSNFLISDFNLQIIGAERIAIVGKNGSGKSTLIQLIRNQLLPLSGTIKIGIDHIAYLDQSVSFLDHDQTLLENFLLINSGAKIFDAYSKLAEFQFRNIEAEKRVCDLSGGEKMRAGLAIGLMSQNPPQCIILDEPTNHLDLRSIEAIASILQGYQGAILAVSHDEDFLSHIGITRTIKIAD